MNKVKEEKSINDMNPDMVEHAEILISCILLSGLVVAFVALVNHLK